MQAHAHIDDTGHSMTPYHPQQAVIDVVHDTLHAACFHVACVLRVVRVSLCVSVTRSDYHTMSEPGLPGLPFGIASGHDGAHANTFWVSLEARERAVFERRSSNLKANIAYRIDHSETSNA